ncbi:MAG: glycosyltransferase family 2 protein [Anaerolineales bacterium]
MFTSSHHKRLAHKAYGTSQAYGGSHLGGALFWLGAGLTAYSYAGYPLLVTLLARLRPPVRFPAPSAWPPVTVLIAAYNEADVIARKIENTLALDYPPALLQILVVTDGSDDDTPQIARRYAHRGVEVLHHPERRGKMAAINRAMQAARGEIVVFSDANNLYQPDALRYLVAPFGQAGIGAVSGAKVVLEDGDTLGASEGLYWRYESFIKQQETRLGSCTGVAGEIFAIRRALFTPAPPGIINDDFYLMLQILRQGYRVVYAPQARSTERVSASAQDEIERRSRIVAGRYQALARAPRWLPWQNPLLVWQIVSHKFTRPLVPLGMLAALLGNLLAVKASRRTVRPSLWRLSPPFGRPMLWGQAFFYLAALSGRFLPLSGKITKVFYLPRFLLDSNLAALQGLLRFARGRQTVAWQRVRRRM